MSFVDRFLRAKEEPRWLIEAVELRPGRTPEWIRRILKDGVHEVFDVQLKESRADNALFVCRIVAKALRELEVRAWVEAGGASWKNYPIGFIYKGRAEFHPWLVTEFDELVDLSCDNLHLRKRLPMKVKPGPKTCFTKRTACKDRKYQAVEGAPEACGVFGKVDLLLEPAEAMLRGFVEAHRTSYESRYPGRD